MWIKRFKNWLPVILLTVFFVPPAFGAGSCTPSWAYQGPLSHQLLFDCTGDAVDGSIPDIVMGDTAFNLLQGHRLEFVSAWPVSGGPAPSAANVFVLDVYGEDLLGSPDGGTTAGQGANLIDPVYKQTTQPFPNKGVGPNFPIITHKYTLRVTGQTTAGARYYVLLGFAK